MFGHRVEWQRKEQREAEELEQALRNTNNPENRPRIVVNGGYIPKECKHETQ